MSNEMTNSPVWLITGCSSGLGRALAEHALERGDRVAVTARDRDAVADLAAPYGDRALALELDVTDPDSATAAVRACEAEFAVVDADSPPLRLLLGSDALAGARGRPDRIRQEIDANQALTKTADLEEV